MKIFSAEQIRDWDRVTIEREGITSVELMERAAIRCLEWIMQSEYASSSFHIVCGVGNNGGDGLAIARMLQQRQLAVIVYLLGDGTAEPKGSADHQANLRRLTDLPGVDLRLINETADLPVVNGTGNENAVIIDALFGTGLNRAPEGLSKQLLDTINASGLPVISIDMPSGLFADRSSEGNSVIRATHTLSFQVSKLAFVIAANAVYTGRVHILPIGLDHAYEQDTKTLYRLADAQTISALYRPRTSTAHKGTYGHALLIAGSYGKMGAAILSARACLRSGVGLLTIQLPGSGYPVLQGAAPEAMVITDFNSSFLTQSPTDAELETYKAIGIGPGTGKASETRQLLRELLGVCRKPMVIDADALNMIGDDAEMQQLIPADTILTPHPKEFERLFGKTNDEFARIELSCRKARELKIVIVLKGHHSLVAGPQGEASFNSTGNAGLAKGGSGDILTGIILALLAQGYKPYDAAVFGVYLHGLAADITAEKQSMESMLPSDVTDHLGAAFNQVAVGRPR